MTLLDVDEKTCNRDGICARVCPMGVIDFSKGGLPAASADAEALCIACGHCVAVCPTGSISHERMTVQHCPPVKKDFHLSAQQCEGFLRNRRSIRTYKRKPVPRDDIARLITVASYAPSGHNSQSPQWRVIDNTAQVNRLAGIVIDWMHWMTDNQPVIAAQLHMTRAIARWEAGSDVILRGAPAVIVAHADKNERTAPAACTIALAYMELAATSMGLGTCWAGYFWAASQGFSPLVDALALPENHQSFGALMVGYPRFAYHRLPLRNAPLISWWDES